MHLTRRTLLVGASALALAGPVAGLPLPTRRRVDPVPAGFVRLRPSIFADAASANRRYLFALDPVRLLHNFYLSAGLDAPRPGYGGWEALGIAGHSLGHWLSACSLVIANTGDAELAAALDHALVEMARIQAAHGDGYCGGTTVERDGKTVDGKIVFEELRRGDIRTEGFDLNGGWVPLYTWHKVHAGLLDAHLLARNRRALPIALGVASYMATVLEPLTDDQMQHVLRTEHGGLNESYARTHAITGDARWLRLAEKIRHKAVLDPLTAGRDQLAGLHANTQIPKLIGLARLYEITGNPDHAAAARFFHQTVTRHHSYVIGGNSEREHFGPPDKLARRLSEGTCEACNSYNMLKLTRHLYSWQPDAAWFDIYERIQLNHIMAHQRPDTGRFVYFMPLSSGARRTYSEPEDSFWCCVGSGMESHAKHADSIYWSDGSTLFVNLFIPSTLDWTPRGFAATLDTALPDRGKTRLVVDRATRRRQAVALRLPGWTRNPRLVLNGSPVTPTIRDGYAVIDRRWTAGDTVVLHTPMEVAVEAMPDDPSLVAFRHGPVVLAADLGPASASFDGVGPALVTPASPADLLRPGPDPHHYTARAALGEELRIRPFFSQYDRRTAVYFPTFTPAGWSSVKADYLRAQEAAATLARRTVDTVYLGEMQPERDHGFAATQSEVVNWKGRSARRLRPGGTMRITMARSPGPSVLRIVIWGTNVDRPLDIRANGIALRPPAAGRAKEDAFVAVDYPMPDDGGGRSGRVEVTFATTRDDAVVYEVRVLKANAPAPSPAA